MDLVIRFLVGGLVVSFFSMIGGALKPKSFAGLFAAAPSVPLATISLMRMPLRVPSPNSHHGRSRWFVGVNSIHSNTCK
jgi:hypothetical protein